jgi:hypothetical protein
LAHHAGRDGYVCVRSGRPGWQIAAARIAKTEADDPLGQGFAPIDPKPEINLVVRDVHTSQDRTFGLDAKVRP